MCILFAVLSSTLWWMYVTVNILETCLVASETCRTYLDCVMRHLKLILEFWGLVSWLLQLEQEARLWWFEMAVDSKEAQSILVNYLILIILLGILWVLYFGVSSELWQCKFKPMSLNVHIHAQVCDFWKDCSGIAALYSVFFMSPLN